jgi:hypothetical protein
MAVPAVPPGRYLIKFGYYVEPGADGNTREREQLHTLCAPLQVKAPH